MVVVEKVQTPFPVSVQVGGGVLLNRSYMNFRF